MKSIGTSIFALLIPALCVVVGCDNGETNPTNSGGQGGQGQGGGGTGGEVGGSLSLDTSYGTQGIAHVDRASSNDFIMAAATTTDGSILLGGSSESMLGVFATEPMLARYTATGAIDTTFGDGGFIVFPWGDRTQVTSIVATLDNGAIVSGAWERWGREWAFLARVDAQGKLDSSFGTSGLTLVESDGGKNFPFIARSPSGAIFLLANSSSGSSKNLWLWRFDENGQIDTTFGTLGHVGIDDDARDLLIQPGGDLLALVMGSSSAYVYRFHADGTADDTFGTAGKITIPFEAYDLEQNAAGEFLVGGGENGGQLMKFDTNGAVVASFGAGGTVSVGVEGVALAKWLANGDILIADANASNFPRRSFRNVLRLAPDGSMASFDDTATQTFGAAFNVADVLINGDQVFLAGDKWKTLSKQQTTIYAIQTGGMIVSTFGMNGLAQMGSLRQSEILWNMGLAPDKSIVAYGVSNKGFITRLVNGQPDAGFATGGFLDHNFPGVGALAVDGMNRILKSLGASPTVYRHNAAGMPDMTFGMNGSATLTGGLFVEFLKVDSKQRILAGSAGSSGSTVFIARLLEDGSPDLSFGTMGVVSDLQVVKDTPLVLDALVNEDGSIIIGGRHNPPQQPTHSFVVRLLENGTVDTSFGTGGVVDVDEYLLTQTLAPRKSGGYLISGQDFACASKLDCPTVVVAIDAQGKLDSNFGTAGIVRVQGGTYYDSAPCIVELPDETIVVTGASEENATQRFTVWRLDKDGSMDPKGPFVLPGKGRATKAIVDGNELYVGGWLFDPKTGSNLVTLRFNN